jgi:hypothetical protein
MAEYRDMSLKTRRCDMQELNEKHNALKGRSVRRRQFGKPRLIWGDRANVELYQ